MTGIFMPLAILYLLVFIKILDRRASRKSNPESFFILIRDILFSTIILDISEVFRLLPSLSSDLSFKVVILLILLIFHLTSLAMLLVRKEQVVSFGKTSKKRQLMLYVAMFYMFTNGFTIYHLLINV